MALGEGDRALNARGLSGLARPLAFTSAIDQGAAVGKQAVAMARRLGDRFTVFATLRTSLYTRYARWGPEFLADRHAAAGELMQLAERGEDGLMMMGAQTWHLFDLMELGNIQTVDTLPLLPDEGISAFGCRPLQLTRSDPSRVTLTS